VSTVPTIHDVARAAGVSIKTVSNVLNDNPKVGPETRARIRQLIDELGYRPNLSARGLRSGKTSVIALAVPSLRENYFAELADSVIRAAARRGLRVVIEQTNGDRELEIEALSGGELRFIDGLLFSPAQLGQKDVDLLATRGPVVLLGERIFGGPTDHVTMHNTEGARAATAHLISLGRRRIAVVGAHRGEVIGSAGLRLAGYRQALAEADIPYDDRLIAEVGGWFRSGGAQAMRELLDSGAHFDGLVAFNDSMALGAMRVMQEAGLRIPADVAVIGYDDIDETRYTLPTLSTIDPGKDEIAEVAVRYLLERIARPDDEIAPREYLAAYRLVQRESTTLG